MFFERNCIVKLVNFFASFCWLWDFLLENLKLKRNSDDVRGNVCTNIKKLYAQNNILKKRILNMTFWIIYILVQISILGTALGYFSQFFFNFCRRPTIVADIFSQPISPIKSFLRSWLTIIIFLLKKCPNISNYSTFNCFIFFF